MGDKTPTKTLFPSEGSSDEEMGCEDNSSPGASGRLRRTPKQTAYGASARVMPRPSAAGFDTPKQTAANADGFRAACENPSAPAVGNKPPLPNFDTPKGTPMATRSIRTPVHSSGIAGAAAFDCTPVNQPPTNAEITGALTKDKVIFFDFDGVLSPVGLVSDRRVFKLKKIDRVDGLLFVNGIKVNGIEARQRDLNILKQQYSLCICSQNIHGHIVTFCNQFYHLGFFDVIIGKKAIGCPKINKQDEMLKVLSGGTALFIDDTQGEINNITDERIDPKKIDAWTLDSEPADLLGLVRSVDMEPRELRLRF